MTVTKIRQIERKRLHFKIRGTSPLIQHQWSEKALRMMRNKGEKKSVTRSREARNPQAEAEAATYRTDGGCYGIPLMAIKTALISAAHKDVGLEKTLVRKALFFPSTDSGLIAQMECSEPLCREDTVRVGAGAADLRYRPEFAVWSVELMCEYDAGMLSFEDILNLVARAGFGVGIGEWRPEKGGEYGRFDLDMGYNIRVEEV